MSTDKTFKDVIISLLENFNYDDENDLVTAIYQSMEGDDLCTKITHYTDDGDNDIDEESGIETIVFKFKFKGFDEIVYSRFTLDDGELKNHIDIYSKSNYVKIELTALAKEYIPKWLTRHMVIRPITLTDNKTGEVTSLPLSKRLYDLDIKDSTISGYICGCTFVRCKFTNVTFSNGKMLGIAFKDSRITNLKFNNFKLEDIDFEECSTSELLFKDSHIYNVHIVSGNTTCVCLENTNASYFQIRRARVNNMRICNDCHIDQSNVTDTMMPGLIMEGAYDNCTFEKVDMVDADWSKAKFVKPKCEHYFCKFKSCEIKDIKLPENLANLGITGSTVGGLPLDMLALYTAKEVNSYSSAAGNLRIDEGYIRMQLEWLNKLTNEIGTEEAKTVLDNLNFNNI